MLKCADADGASMFFFRCFAVRLKVSKCVMMMWMWNLFSSWRIFQPSADFFLLTMQFVQFVPFPSIFKLGKAIVESVSYRFCRTNQAKPARPGPVIIFDSSLNGSTQFQVRARLTWRPPHFDGVQPWWCGFQSIPFDLILHCFCFLSSARVISVTATTPKRLTNSMMFDVWMVRYLCEWGHFGLSASINWKCKCECECECGCGAALAN